MAAKLSKALFAQIDAGVRQFEHRDGAVVVAAETRQIVMGANRDHFNTRNVLENSGRKTAVVALCHANPLSRPKRDSRGLH